MGVELSWALLGWGAVALVSAINARRPAYSAYLRGFSFMAQAMVAECAPWVLVWVAGGAGVLVWMGALSAWPGWLGAGASAIAVGLLGWEISIALKAEGAVAAALDTAGIAELGPGSGRWRRALLPRWFNAGGVERIANLRYADGSGSRRMLDLYRPRGRVQGAPVLLQIHGGAWVIGSKLTQGRPLLTTMAREGWICVAINYRLSPRVQYPGHLIDCKLALKWIREHIAEYGGDPERVAVTGGSAGGHLAAMVALTANQPEYQPGFETVDTSVLACVPVYGAIDLVGVFARVAPRLAKWFSKLVFGGDLAKASPLTHIREGLVPMLIIQGTADPLVPAAVARNFAAAARAAGNLTVVHVEIEGAGHAFDIFHSIRSEATIAGIRRFLDAVMGHRARSLATAALEAKRR